MKKTKLMFLLSLFLTSIPLAAQTEDEAKLAAVKFLQQKKGVTLSNLSTVKVVTGKSAATRSADGTAGAAVKGGDVYAFNADGGGFAVVCTGNGNTAVAGYSEKGKVNVATMPEPMKEWLASYAAAMINTKEILKQDPSYTAPTAVPVAPLIKTQWGQGAPFNGKCPSNGKQTTLAGCVPVALAQVLNYYRSDHKGTGQLYYAHQEAEMEYDINYATTSYDWNNMLDNYEEGKYSQTQADAVGKLMVECGVASKANYGYGETSASAPFVALNKYYGFDCTYLQRDFYVPGSIMEWGSDKKFYQPTTQWMKVIQDELAAGRPIIYSANNRKGDRGVYSFPEKAHCFVIDGIDADSYVHCNWGWSGLDDGYYDIAMLRPASMEFLHDEQGYNCHHEMIVGIQPSSTPYEEQLFIASQPFGDYNFLYSNSYDSGSYTFSMVLMQDGDVAKFLNSYSVDLRGWPYVGNFSLRNCTQIYTGDLVDGDYDYRVLCARKSGDGYLLCPLPDALVPSIAVKDRGTEVYRYGFGDEKCVKDLVIQDIKPASEIYAGTAFYLSIKGQGFEGKSSLNFRNMETGVVYGNQNGGETSFEFNHLYDDYTSSPVFRFVPKNEKNGFSMPAGRYKIELPKSETTVKMEGEYYIDVLERPSYPVMDGSDWAKVYFMKYDVDENRYAEERGYAVVGTSGDYRLTSVKPSYSYANKVEGPVTVKVYMVNIDTGEEMPIAIDTEWVPEKYIPLNFYTYSLSGNYRFRCVYETAAGKRGGLVQYKDPDEFMYYLIPPSPTGYMVFQLDSANVTKENGKGSLDLTLINLTEEVVLNIYLNAIIYDKENDEIRVEDFACTVPEVKPYKSFHVNLETALKEQTGYSVWLFSSTRVGDKKSCVIDGINKLARIDIGRDGSNGISSVSLSDKMFNDGETVKVYDAKGILVKTVVASGHLFTDLQSQLAAGHYILKSSAKSLKFRK